MHNQTNNHNLHAEYMTYKSLQGGRPEAALPLCVSVYGLYFVCMFNIVFIYLIMLIYALIRLSKLISFGYFEYNVGVR